MKTNEAEKITEALKELESHPMMKKIQEEKAQAILRKRQAAAAAVKDMERTREEFFPGLLEELDSLQDELVVAEAAVSRVRSEVAAKKQEVSSETLGFERRINQHKAILEESCDPRIDEAIQFFRDALDRFRKPGVIVKIGRASILNPINWMKQTFTETNRESVLDALTYCKDAIKSLEVVKLEPEFPAKKVEDLKKGIPSIDNYTEVTGEAEGPKVNTDPFAGLPSDSELDWKKKNLEEKHRKIMRKKR